MAIDKGNQKAAYNFGCFYEQEGKYELMKKYMSLAADNGIIDAMTSLAYYYGWIEKKDDLKIKYLLMAIELGDEKSLTSICHYSKMYYNNYTNEEDILNILLATIKGNLKIERKHLGPYKINGLLDYMFINSMCKIIDNDNLSIINFKYCLLRIFDYIKNSESFGPFGGKLYVEKPNIELENLGHFMEYISKLYYCYGTINMEYNKCLTEVLKNSEVSQIFIEYMDLYYYKYVHEKYKPDGPTAKKLGEHYNAIQEQRINNKNLKKL
jgi:hypothetical protein